VKAFGPVPSRRLGRSLGINNIPPKACTYSCTYCQVGRTSEMSIERRRFYDPDEIVRDVRMQVRQAIEAGETIDYLTFVPDGEPTLDVHLGREIELLKPLGIPIAVITNASLLWREDVRAELMSADWVSFKVDAVREDAWRRVDRPRRSLRLSAILDGALTFAATYPGTLVTETMLVEGVNDGEECIREVSSFLARLRPDADTVRPADTVRRGRSTCPIAYLSIPTRPPAETWVRAPGEEAINRAYQILSSKVQRVEYLIGYEGNAFASTGDLEDDLLSITAVHPMREDAVNELLTRAGASWPVVRRLVARDQLVETAYGGHTFYVRRLDPRHQAR
jgi:wyosine [tRNA(Phe)-imidazoG37] synthetase (radical SAM superfamily)